MTKDAQILKLRRKLADAEAVAADLRGQLERLESGHTVAQAAEGGDVVLALWKAALGIARTRSSKRQCQVMWNRVPKAERPDLDTALAALKKWNRCEEWTKDACMFAPGLHKWIDRRGWEDVPETRPEVDPLAKYKPIRKAAQEPEAELATDEDLEALMSNFRTPCTPAATPVQPAGNSGENCQIPAETGNSDTISLTSSLLEDRPVTP